MTPLESLLTRRRVLLLQGPMGNFFNRVAQWLQTQGIEVYKVNLNGGDWLFHRGPRVLDYQGRLEDFGFWLGCILEQLQIDGVVCFGDCRAYHRMASAVAQKRQIPFYVFEEGYLRPDYLTLEQGGVNAYSQLATLPSRVLHQELPHVAPVSAAHPRFSRMALSAIAYYAAGWLMRWRYPHYRHHKDFSPFRELFYWLRSGWRKIIYQQLEKPVVCRIGAQDVQQYFLVPLQVFNDSQILHHSPYADIREFISEVLDSFARYAAPEHHLVIKHHPMDRGHKNYRLLIAELAANAGIRARVHYIHDAHLPSLLKSCAGVVTINSTVGLSALHHGKSVMAMGRAFYDLAGLTSQNGLNDFWCNPAPVDALLYKKLRSFLIRNTQLNGAFYGQAHWMRSAEKYARQNVHRQLELHHPQRRSI